MWDKVKNRIYQRMYRKFHGKNFPKSEFEKAVSLERMKIRMKALEEPFIKKNPKKRVVYVDVSPRRELGVLQDLFQNPNEIPQSKREQLDDFMRQPKSYRAIMAKIKELEQR